MITKEQYGEWRNHPATLFFRKFLKDRRDYLIGQATEAWLNSNGQFPDGQALGRVLELFDVEDVQFEKIETFYKEHNEGEAA